MEQLSLFDDREKSAPLASRLRPESLEGRRYYHPTEEGQEGTVKEKLERILAWKMGG